MRLLAAGGTIAMRGERAVPELDAAQLLEQLPEGIASDGLEAESVLSLPSAQMTLPQAFEVARRAVGAASDGAGVVLTAGTDTMEELAVLCCLLHDGDAPIVLTGANRPDSEPGADGPANLRDALMVAGARQSEGIGTVVVFGGEVHAAMTVRKVDSTGPSAFGSPAAGPLGRVAAGRVWLHAKPIRPRTLPVAGMTGRVEMVAAALGDDGALLRHAAESADGVVLVALGAGHVPPAVLHELRRATERVPVIVTCRPERGMMLASTYGFEGSESDVRGSDAICAPFLSPAAARIALLCCLGAGFDRDAIAAALTPWDAQPG